MAYYLSEYPQELRAKRASRRRKANSEVRWRRRRSEGKFDRKFSPSPGPRLSPFNLPAPNIDAQTAQKRAGLREAWFKKGNLLEINQHGSLVCLIVG